MLESNKHTKITGAKPIRKNVKKFAKFLITICIPIMRWRSDYHKY